MPKGVDKVALIDNCSVGGKILSILIWKDNPNR